MLVVLASGRDRGADAFALRWACRGARLLTPADLSTAGWWYRPDAPATATAVVSGEVVPVGRIAGVLTRLPRVDERELSWVAPDERAYVAAEATAFLSAWLASLACPVLNRPTACCLAGPGWSPERWLGAAAALGMPVRPLHRLAIVATLAPRPRRRPGAVATVVGARCFGTVPDGLKGWARRLAELAEVDLLAVHFSGTGEDAAFVGADPWPDISSPELGAAVIALFSEDGGQ